LDRPVVRGYAAFKLDQMPTKLELEQGTIESTLLPHGGVNTLGLIFTERSSGKKFTYYTDCKRVPREAVALAKGSDVVVLDGLRPTPHPSHMTIGEATEVTAEIGAPLSYLTHLTHLTSHAEVEAGLPESVRVAYDGLKLNL
jgi:phosphoribosyl 1,2-cyclic phosphate phosphodiesterase